MDEINIHIKLQTGFKLYRVHLAIGGTQIHNFCSMGIFYLHTKHIIVATKRYLITTVVSDIPFELQVLMDHKPFLIFKRNLTNSNV